VRRANTYGALDMGLAPGLLPGRLDASSSAAAGVAAAWGSIPDGSGSDCLRILNGMREGSLHALLLMGADPVRDVAQGPLAAEALAAAGFVVAVDQFLTDSSRLADVVLPAEGFAEKDGTVTNLEGRVQRVNRVVSGPGQTRPDWSVLDDLAARMGNPLGLGSAEGIAKEIAEVAPAYRGVTWDLLDFEGRDGVVVPHDDAVQPLRYTPSDPGLVARPIPIALHLARVMYDDGVLMRMGPSLRKLAPGAVAHLHPDDALRMRVHDGDPVVLRGAAGDIEMPVRVDPSLRPGVVYVPFNQPGCPVLSSDPRISLQRP
jgi:predicted molibdopterin-dependent oxidoreductase YjgC